MNINNFARIFIVICVCTKLYCSASGIIPLFVLHSEHGTQAIELSTNANVADLSRQVCQTFGIPESRTKLRLLHGGVDLLTTHENNALSSDVGICAEAVIELQTILMLRFELLIMYFCRIFGTQFRMTTDIEWTGKAIFKYDLAQHVRKYVVQNLPRVNATTRIKIELLFDERDYSEKQIKSWINYETATDIIEAKVGIFDSCDFAKSDELEYMDIRVPVRDYTIYINAVIPSDFRVYSKS